MPILDASHDFAHPVEGWTYEGCTGYGISEYLHQLDADGRPLVPIE